MKTFNGSIFMLAKSARRISAFAVVMASVATAAADDFNLYYSQPEGAAATLVAATSQIDKIVFEDSGVKVVLVDGKSTTLAATRVKRLFFSTEKTVGLTDTPVVLTQALDADVKDMTGRVVGKVKDFDSLSKGIYVIGGKKVIKID